jgi:L-asparagine transporter-like permease
MVKNKKIVLEKSGEKEEKNKVAIIEKLFDYLFLFIVFLLALIVFAEHPVIALIFIISVILTLITLYLIKGDDIDEK